MKDFRSEVQRTGVKILMACVIDDQANNAPAEIILGVLTNVMASTCAVLTENICQILSERHDSNSAAGATEENSHKLSSIINPALEALSALCRGVLAHLPRIINLSLFNQLWSQVRIACLYVPFLLFEHDDLTVLVWSSYCTYLDYF